MSKQPEKTSNNTKRIVIAVGVAIVAALLIAVLSGGDSNGDSSGSAANQGDASSSTGENQAVEVVGAVLEPLPESGADPVAGLEAPTINGSSFDGTPITVNPGDGQNYMLVFLAHWCPHCNREVPRLIEWQASGAIPADLQIIGISTAVASDRPNYPPSQWVVDKGWPWPVMADSKNMDAAEAYGVSGFPFFVFVGADGTVKIRKSGEIEIEQLNQLVAEALAD